MWLGLLCWFMNSGGIKKTWFYLQYHGAPEAPSSRGGFKCLQSRDQISHAEIDVFQSGGDGCVDVFRPGQWGVQSGDRYRWHCCSHHSGFAVTTLGSSLSLYPDGDALGGIFQEKHIRQLFKNYFLNACRIHSSVQSLQLQPRMHRQ